ncbi:hypothetical protein BMF94_5857 [Rhodotorula taiwanensis]|uniref:Uncharacterized protein n=1 Tax=Rhodotorula taiwanensis TaxID=741276 RepID=A0A2S5B2V6_9BASI|nr:hypothetical protein BMF94_5857 [Rhodotorula taiwanensis]
MSAPTPTASAAQTGVAEQQHPIDSLHGPGKVEVERTGATPAATTPASTTTTEPRTTGTEKVETHVAAAPERTESKRDVERKEPVSEEGAAAPAAAADDDIPVNAHAGKVGYGPSYAGNSGIADQLKGTEEKIKGKLFHKPELVQQGEERKAGILAERKQAYDAEHEETAFDKPIADKKDAPPGGAAGAGAKDNVDPKTQANAATSGTKEKTV